MNKTVVNNFIEQSKELKYFQIIMLVILWVPVVTKASTVHCSDQTTQIIFSGTLLASSTMGLTLFDLFGEIVTEADLKFFLRFDSILFLDRPDSPGQSKFGGRSKICEPKKVKMEFLTISQRVLV